MTFKTDLESAVREIFQSPWKERKGKVVPAPESLSSGNDAVKLSATVLYADMADFPNHDGVEGTDWGEVWMLTAEDAILLIKPPFEEILSFFFPFKEALFCALYHTPSTTSLRIPWGSSWRCCRNQCYPS